jgi:HSP20 family protein
MFSLMPWRKEQGEGEMARRAETPLGLMRREFASLFDRFFGGFPIPFEVAREEPPTYWGLDLVEEPNEVVVKAEMPGFEPGEIEVLVTGEMLTIRAEHKAKKEGKGKEEPPTLRHVERTVTLPAGTDKEKVEAVYRNGVLEVHFPKTPEAKGRRIEVRT